MADAAAAAAAADDDDDDDDDDDADADDGAANDHCLPRHALRDVTLHCQLPVLSDVAGRPVSVVNLLVPVAVSD